MMEFIFSMLLVPLLPELGDPHINHASAITALEGRLSEKRSDKLTKKPVEGAVTPAHSLIASAEALPAISGRLFQWSDVEKGGNPNGLEAVDLLAESLRLTGLIESAGQKVAILNDGQDDHVVGVGSFVLGTYKVASFGPGRVVLFRIDSRSGERRLELNLIQEETPGGGSE